MHKEIRDNFTKDMIPCADTLYSFQVERIVQVFLAKCEKPVITFYQIRDHNITVIVPVNILNSMQQSLQEQPENTRAMAILEDYRRSTGHPDAEDIDDLRRFIGEHIRMDDM